MLTKDSTVAVTGGAGFIGSHLVDALIDRKAKVLVIDDFSSGDPANLAQHQGNRNLRILKADIRDEQMVNSAIEGAEYVFHLACRNVRLSLRRPTEVHEVNATGTLNLLKAATRARVRRFLYVSSSEVNGTADVVPMPEDYRFKPETVYGASKLAGEYYAQVFFRSGWLRTAIARPHNNYGPREHYRGVLGEVIPRFILRARAGLPPIVFGDGSQTRDFTYVRETVECLIGILEHDGSAGGTYNVCRGEEASVLDIARMVVELSGKDLGPEFVPARPSDVLRLFGDPSRLRELLGWSPAISLREGLKRTMEWFEAHVPVTRALLASMDSRNWEQVAREDWLHDPGPQRGPGS